MISLTPCTSLHKVIEDMTIQEKEKEIKRVQYVKQSFVYERTDFEAIHALSDRLFQIQS